MTKSPAAQASAAIALSAAARSILLMGTDPQEPKHRRIVSHLKSSLIERGPSLVFELREGQFQWVGESPLSADDLLSAAMPHDERARLDEAVDFLADTLNDGERPTTEILAEAKRIGLSESTLRRAKEQLGVRAMRASAAGGERGQGGVGVGHATPYTPGVLTILIGKWS
jgi:hypothetical protein